MVDDIILCDDEDDSARDAIRMVRKIYPIEKIIFANGGDRTEKIYLKWILKMRI